MRSRRSRLALLGSLALALTVTAGLTVGSAEAKKKKKSKTFAATKVVNQGIPDAPAVAGPSTPVRVEFDIGKKFKKKVVGDVNLTFQTSGNGAGAADDLSVNLTAPGGRTGLPFEALGDFSIGPLTLDDDTPTMLCNEATPICSNPNATLIQPFAGRANTLDQDDDMRPLSIFDGVAMRGTWTFLVFDQSDVGVTSTLNQVGLEVKAAKPVKG